MGRGRRGFGRSSIGRLGGLDGRGGLGDSWCCFASFFYLNFSSLYLKI